MALNFKNIQDEIASRVRLTGGSTNQLVLIKRWINLTIQDVSGRHDWYWSKKRQIVQTTADKSDGTVSISAGGTSVTGVGTSFASTDVGKFIQINDTSNDWYKILSVPNATSLTIEKPLVGSVSASASDYVIRQWFYSVPGAEKVLDVMQSTTPRKLEMEHFRNFDFFKPFTDSTGEPRTVFMFGVDSSGDIRFTVWPWPSTVMNLEIRYKNKAIELTSDSDEPEVPAKWRKVIVDGALVMGLEYIATGQREFNPALINSKKADYERGIQRMLDDSEPESDTHTAIINPDIRITDVGPMLPDKFS